MIVQICNSIILYLRKKNTECFFWLKNKLLTTFLRRSANNQKGTNKNGRIF